MNNLTGKFRILTIVFLGIISVEAIKLIIGEDILDTFEQLSDIYKISSAIFVVFTALLIHELGHLCVGLLRGLNFQFFFLTFFGFKRNGNNDIIFFINTDPFSFLGVTALAPKEFSPKTIKDLAYTSIAGPFFSFLFFFIGLVSFCLIDSSSINFQYNILGFTISNFIVFCSTVIPSKSGVFFSDRKRFQILMSKGEDSIVETILIKLTRLHDEGLIGSSNFEDISILRNSKHEIHSIFGSLFSYIYFKENNMIPQANIEMSRLLNFNGNRLISLYLRTELNKII